MAVACSRRTAARRSPGAYVEARTAEVFTGGCIMNGEAATTGREALLAWKVDRGSFNGVALERPHGRGRGRRRHEPGHPRDSAANRRPPGRRCSSTSAPLRHSERRSSRWPGRLSNGVIGNVVELTPTAIQFVDEGPAIRVSAKSLRLTVEQGDEARSDLRRQAVVPSARGRSTVPRWARRTRTRSAARRSARSGATRTSARRSSAPSRTNQRPLLSRRSRHVRERRFSFHPPMLTRAVVPSPRCA